MRLPGGGRLPLKELLKRLYVEQDKDGVSDASAQLSYYLLFALFPFMVFLTTLVAYLPLGAALNRGLSQIQAFLPQDARQLIQERLTGVLTTKSKRAKKKEKVKRKTALASARLLV